MIAIIPKPMIHLLGLAYSSKLTALNTPDVSRLSLCPGVLESYMVFSSTSITSMLIEKAEDEIVYR